MSTAPLDSERISSGEGQEAEIAALRVALKRSRKWVALNSGGIRHAALDLAAIDAALEMSGTVLGHKAPESKA